MKTNEYQIIQAGFAVLTLVCVVFLFVGLTKALGRSTYSKDKQRKILAATAAIVSGWIILVTILSVSGVTARFSSFPPPLAFLLLPPVFIAIYLIFTGKLDNVLERVPATWFLYFQSFRIIVEILLWRLFIINFLPVQMSFEGRNYDVLTGIFGILVAYFYSKGKLSNVFLTIYNVFGLITLLNIVVIAILSMPTPLRVFMNEPANTVVGNFPVIFLPTLLVPFAYWFHFLSLRKSYIERKKHLDLIPVQD
jgi:hypothetical protein